MCKVFTKYSDLGHIIFEPIFPQPCRNISRKITGKVAQRFPLSLHGRFLKLFWNILCLVWKRIQTFYPMFWQFWSNIYWNIPGKLPVKILVTSHTKSSRNFSAKFLEIFRPRSQAFQPIFLQPCRNIFRKVTRKVVETFPVSFQKKILKLSCNILCKYWTEIINISRNIVESFLKDFMNNFMQASLLRN